MDKYIPEGGFTIARKIFDSGIWSKPPLYFKVWVWIIGNANHSDRIKGGYKYKRGELVTNYDEIIKANTHFYNRKHIFPTMKQIRIILEWLQKKGMIAAKPLKSELERTGADTTADTRAYIGLKIIVTNYDTYQDIKNYRGRHHGRDLNEQGHNNNKLNKLNTKESPDFFSLKNKYDPILINKVFRAFASTRKNGKIADSVLFTQLRKWDRYPVEQVKAGIQIYLEKDYAGQGKREEYLLGIIRNQKPDEHETAQHPQQKEITMDNIGELYEN